MACIMALTDDPTETFSFQDIIAALCDYWRRQGCLIERGIDMEVGAGTFHSATFLRALGPEPWYTAFVQPVRRPVDGRYGMNPNRLQHYYQFQVLMKPAPADMQERYLASLAALGLDLAAHDVRFVEDNWESPTLGAWGLGWEVWLDGMEISQYTYFQQVGGLACRPVPGEITYGLERIAMYLQDKSNVRDLLWGRTLAGDVHYGDIYQEHEAQMSQYNFEQADTTLLQQWLAGYESECARLNAQDLPWVAHAMLLKASHVFNLLDARRVLSVTERQRCVARIRTLACACAESYVRGQGSAAADHADAGHADG